MSIAPLTLEPVNGGVYRVVGATGQHVGNLKLIGGQWKFKAVGYTEQGALVPGGGPLTAKHNEAFERPEASEVSAVLMESPGTS